MLTYTRMFPNIMIVLRLLLDDILVLVPIKLLNSFRGTIFKYHKAGLLLI